MHPSQYHCSKGGWLNAAVSQSMSFVNTQNLFSLVSDSVFDNSRSAKGTVRHSKNITKTNLSKITGSDK